MSQSLTYKVVRLFSSAIFLLSSSFLWAQNCPDSIGFTIIPVDVAKGEEFCVDLTVDDFDSIETLQFSLNWDPTVLDLISVEPFNLRYLTLAGNFNIQRSKEGILTIVWFDQDGMNGETLADGTIIFRLCFNAVGQPGDSTAIVISDVPRQFEASNANGDDLCLKDNNAGNIFNITLPSMLCVVANTCGTDGSDGSVKITVWGGQRPYTYDGIMRTGVLNNQGDMVVWNGLSPGTYNITVVDNTGADTTLVVEVVDGPAIQISTVQQVNPSCDGSTPGSIEIDVQGGSPPYSIAWSPISKYNVTSVTGLMQGMYSVTVKDSLGCTVTEEFELLAGDIDVDIEILSNATCVGVDNGQIRANVSGGVPPYEFSATGNTYFAFPGNSITLNNQSGGASRLFIRDADGCIRPVVFDIPVDKQLNAFSIVSDVRCFGGSDGRLDIEGRTDGNPIGPYGFLLEDAQNNIIVGGINRGTSYTSPNLVAGTYFFTLSDNDGCIYMDTFEVNQPPPLTATLIDSESIESCNPGNDAYFEVNATGGNGAPYVYDWFDVGIIGARASGLSVGSHSVEVSDANGCLDTLTFNVTPAIPPTITGFDSVSVNCTGAADGSLTVLFTPGSSPVSGFIWSNGSNGATASNLTAGDYCVTITDEKGCEAIECARLGLPSGSLRVDSIVTDAPACFGDQGTIRIFASGGQRPYTYSWSTGEVFVDRPVFAGVDAGTYYVTITDDGNCGEVIDTVILNQPLEIQLELLATQAAFCPDDSSCTGRAGISIEGGPNGASGYFVSWSNNITDTILNGLPATNNFLCPGENFIVAVNELCGSDTLFFDIPKPDPLVLNPSATTITPPSCNGRQDGSVTVQAQGGNTGTYSYRWVPSGTAGTTLNNIGRDTLYVEITDRRGCVNIDSVIIPEPDTIRGFVLTQGTRDVSCFGDSDGRIALDWTGGNPGPATYQWSPNVTTDSVATDLLPGTYEITIIDKNGCSNTLTHVVNEPQPLQADIPDPDQLLCDGDRTEINVIGVSGGNGPDYYYTVNNSGRQDIGEPLNVLAGSYLISVFDRAGCRFDTTLTITQPGALSVSILQAPQVRVPLGEMVELEGVTQGTGLIIGTEWTPPNNLSDPNSLITKASPDKSEVYTLTVFDENGCSAEASVRIIVDAARKVFVPNAFTPNGDGVNDIFWLSTGPGVESIESFEVFNRWGDRVFEIGSPIPAETTNGFGWDGTYGGRLLEPQVFAYRVRIRFIDQAVITYQGDVTLIR
jgi:gliding motility-associated-like protein